MSDGPNIDAIYRQPARFAVKLLKTHRPARYRSGSRPNSNWSSTAHTADAIGIQLSPDYLASADRLIE
jgi:hypothetical protein